MSPAVEGADRQQRWTAVRPALIGGLAPVLLCAVLAAVSAQLQGFEFGIDNNVFHIPIVLHWYDLPQFSNDVVMQSLRRYATPVFPILGLFANDTNIAAVFHAAFLLTRGLAIFALFQVMRSCGLRNLYLAAATVSAIFVSALYGESIIGRDELLVDIFTHTALAQAIALLGVAGLIRGRLIAAAIAGGLTFDLNAMVGLWYLAPFTLVCASQLATAPRTSARRIVRAVMAFSLVAFPVAIWIALSQNLGAPDFDYRAYLRDYYPYHFFIGWAEWSQRIVLALQVASGFTAASLLPRNRGNAVLVLLALMLLFLAGITIGQISHSRALLNLHLLRVDGMLTWTIVPLVLTASFAALANMRILPAMGAIATIGGLIAGDWYIVLGGLLLLAAVRFLPIPTLPMPLLAERQRPALLAIAAMVLALVATTRGAYSARPAKPSSMMVPSDQQLAGAWPRSPEWRQVTDWARDATAADALFIIPLKLDFVAARRRDWVDWKEGAAAMWAPDIYAVWHTRTVDLAALHSAPAILAYACQHGIDYAVFDLRPGHALAGTGNLTRPIFVNRWFAAFPVRDCRRPASGHVPGLTPVSGSGR
ncbi:MAG TPA: hypothetical protein VHZ32_15060 [Rhizomicrobium sp.]|nr:hypothetical protein [Rhizomicrobium sp.]